MEIKYPELTVTEAFDERVKLEQDVKNLIDKFEQKTLLKVVSVQIGTNAFGRVCFIEARI